MVFDNNNPNIINVKFKILYVIKNYSPLHKHNLALIKSMVYLIEEQIQIID